ncbi:Neuferricin [Orchesella cincta]|uniref:Neuferricin n=1 Tax=Orchesella cincta TaxID=48709 RepID=A0A1D2NGK2_ORCCI|nr:Neuferricin [Orchesella cincta]
MSRKRLNNTTSSGENSVQMPGPGTPSMFSGEEQLEGYQEFEKRLTPSVDDYNGAIPKEQKSARRPEKIAPKVGKTVIGRVGVMGCAIAAVVGIISVGVLLYGADHTMSFFSKTLWKDKPIDKQHGHDPASVPQKLFKKDNEKLDWKSHLVNVQEKLRKGNSEVRIMTDEDIKYKDGGKMYVVLAGFVFDVSSASKTYGKDSGYHGFVGRDGSRAFVTGKFTEEEGLVPNLRDLTPDENKGISNWVNFYLNHETYKFVGLHSGWFFDEKGEKTWRMREFEEALIEAEALDNAQSETDKLFPGCNMEWNAEHGSNLWCSKQSGGMSREWIGFPRSFKIPDDKTSPRCVCVHPNMLTDPRVSVYKGCDPKSVSCKLGKDE